MRTEALIGIVVVAILLVAKLGFWLWWRRRGAGHGAAPGVASASADAGAGANAAAAAPDPAAAPASADAPEERPAALHEQLWRFVFRAGGMPAAVDPAQEQLARAARAALTEGTISDRHFPRRPTLMPQLLAAVNNAAAGPGRLAEIITQDPVLAGDVLRLANSVFLRPGSQPIESIQRAIIVCGTDGLQSLAARALLQPVFRAGGAAFAEFPPQLWEHSTRAALVAGAHARLTRSGDQQTAQLLPLLAALGPLVVYRVLSEQYRAAPELKPAAAVYLRLIAQLGAATTQRIAGLWEIAPRMQQALLASQADAAAGGMEPDVAALVASQRAGALLATLSLLRDAGQLADGDCERIVARAGLAAELWQLLASHARH